MAHAIERVLVKAGFETTIARNGFEAGAMLHTFKPGLMTLDLRMTRMDGTEVLRFLQTVELGAPLKILIVSADTDLRLQEALNLGAHGILSKPFENTELLAAVERMFAGDSVS